MPASTFLSALALALGSVAVSARGCATTWGPDGCVFASHMVLASSDPWRGGSTPARIWGTAAPGESILLSGLPAGAAVLPSNPFSAAADGNWSITVAVPASLTNYSLTFAGKSSRATLQDVLFGHTVLCSGQSNCDMNVGCTFSTNETAVQALLYPEIRMMNQGATGVWVSAAADPASNTSAVQEFSATCYYTAFHLKQSIPAFASVPIGLVRSSVGGQVIERFMTPAAMEAVGVPEINATNTSCEGQSSHTLYDTLIAPLIPFVFKTLVWYQG
jgi:sialate O-acetylesterase